MVTISAARVMPQYQGDKVNRGQTLITLAPHPIFYPPLFQMAAMLIHYLPCELFIKVT